MANGTRVPRAVRWAHESQTTKMRLVLDDMDTQDGRLDGFGADLASIKRILVGLLVSTATGSVLLALNLVAK